MSTYLILSLRLETQVYILGDSGVGSWLFACSIIDEINCVETRASTLDGNSDAIQNRDHFLNRSWPPLLW